MSIEKLAKSLRQAIDNNDSECVDDVLKSAGDRAAAVCDYSFSTDPCQCFAFTPTYTSAIHHALELNRKEILLKILETGANVDSTSSGKGLTPLHVTAQQNNVEIAKILIRYGADLYGIDRKGRCPIHTACASVYVHDTTNIVRYLISEGHQDDVNLCDFKGRTPLHEACKFQKVEVIKLLRQCGADIKAQSSNGNVPKDEGKWYPWVLSVLDEPL